MQTVKARFKVSIHGSVVYRAQNYKLFPFSKENIKVVKEKNLLSINLVANQHKVSATENLSEKRYIKQIQNPCCVPQKISHTFFPQMKK